MEETKRKGSRTYCIVMSHSATGESTMIPSTTYATAQSYLTYWEKKYTQMGLGVERTRTELKASGLLADKEVAIRVWFTENEK